MDGSRPSNEMKSVVRQKFTIQNAFTVSSVPLW